MNALFSKETYLQLVRELQSYAAVQLVGFCLANSIDLDHIPIPSHIYVSKIDIKDELTPIAYLDVTSDNPKVVFMRFEADDPSFITIDFIEFLDKYTALTKEIHSKLSIVPQPTDTKS